MKRSDEFEALFEQLRSLAATDPRRARDALCELLDSNSPHLERIVQRASVPGEGRLRQLIANTALIRGVQERFASDFAKWRALETDEFTRRALDAALSGTQRPSPEPVKRPALIHPGHVDAYRYVGERLKHQLRNALMDPLGHLLRLNGLIEAVPDGPSRTALAAQLAVLKDTLSRMGRIIEFDFGDGHFLVRNIRLKEWLDKFNDEYGRKYQPIQMVIENGSEDTRIQATEFLLGIIFWNLWINSQQAVGKVCKIVVQITSSSKHLELLLVDNGEGLPPDIGVAGFPDAKPRPGHRGRGLLEVQEAVERLHGEVGVVRHSDGAYRVRLRFPLENS
jgi:hypothetical protein